MNQLIFNIAIPSPIRKTFDYLPPKNITTFANLKNPKFNNLIGSRVLVPFGKSNREVVGYIVEINTQSTVERDKLKIITALLDPEPLLQLNIIKLIKWISDYYHYPIGEVFAKAFPSLLRNPKSKNITPEKLTNLIQSKLKNINHSLKVTSQKIPFDKLNLEQQQAINTVNKNLENFKVFLLDGVTGSGKTEVYLHIIEAVILAGKQALILVPEINLTPQTISRFSSRFGVNIAILHSRLTDKEKLGHWLDAKTGNAPIIIGTRSAIFSPIKNLGIIILDEEHDLSFKQHSDLRYSARDVAIIRSNLQKIPIILGSATPSLESIYNCDQNRYTRLILSKRAGDAQHPELHLVDMRNQKLIQGFTPNLIEIMGKHLERNNQVMVFLNRRGYAPVLLCHKCGASVDCKNCDAHLTLHRATQKLHCHHCNYSIAIPNKCTNCETENLLAVGMGTERVEKSLKHLFPGVSVIRIDSDTTRSKGAIEKKLELIKDGTNQILVGTQMLAKGHHFPNVTMVAVLNADNGLYSPDFRASEYLAQLIMQVSGRAGRAKHPGEVYIQTYHPHHPLLLNLVNNGYHSCAEVSLAERKSAKLPPFAYLALFRAQSIQKATAMSFLEALKLRSDSVNSNNNFAVLGPVASIIERKARHYQVQLLLQAKDRATLHKLINYLLNYIDSLKLPRGLKWSLDVDPLVIFN